MTTLRLKPTRAYAEKIGSNPPALSPSPPPIPCSGFFRTLVRISPLTAFLLLLAARQKKSTPAAAR